MHEVRLAKLQTCGTQLASPLLDGPASSPSLLCAPATFRRYRSLCANADLPCFSRETLSNCCEMRYCAKTPVGWRRGATRAFSRMLFRPLVPAGRYPCGIDPAFCACPMSQASDLFRSSRQVVQQKTPAFLISKTLALRGRREDACPY